jgi:multiple sugar transport system substrate-binding protein
MADAARRRWVQGAAGACALAVSGAARAASTAPGGTTLHVATFPDLDRAAKLALPGFARLYPGVRVKITSLAWEDHPTAMITALAAGANLPDLMAMDREIIGKLAESAGLEDLSRAPYQALAHAAKLPPFALAAARSSKGGLAALPVDVGPGTLFYRADLLAQAGLVEADLTNSWNGFIAAGKQLKERTGAYLLSRALDLNDIYVRTSLRSGEGVYFDSGGQVLVDSPRFVRGFELARAARIADIDARVVRWTNEWTEGFRRGRIASQMMGSWLGGHLKNWIAPQLAGRWRSAHLPEGAFASWGGSYYAIPTRARQKELAWALIQYLALDKDQQLLAFRGLDAFPALLQAQEDAFVEEPLPYFGGQRARLLWREAARRIPAVDADRYDNIARDVVEAELEKVLEHNKPITAALADAKAGIGRRVRRL